MFFVSVFLFFVLYVLYLFLLGERGGGGERERGREGGREGEVENQKPRTSRIFLISIF